MNTLQLNLFATGITCCYCLKDPGADPRNGTLWNGIWDLDTQQHVCRHCLPSHYKAKWKSDKKGLYSEFPVSIVGGK